MWVMLTFHPMQGAGTAWYQNLFAAVFVVVFGFLFVTVASRISGLLGNSSNPISGMSIATLMATCAIFLLARVDGAELRGAGADDWRRGVHRGGDCGRDFAGFEDGISGGGDSLLAADGIAGGRDGFDGGDRRDAEPDEQGAGEIYSDADCREPAGAAIGREGGAAGVHVCRERTTC